MQVHTAELAQRGAREGRPWKTLCLDPGTVNTKMLLAGWGLCGIAVRSSHSTTGTPPTCCTPAMDKALEIALVQLWK